MPKFNVFESRLLNTMFDQSIAAETHPMIKEALVGLKEKVNKKPAARAKKPKVEGQPVKK